jgi:WD40 repeat protein
MLGQSLGFGRSIVGAAPVLVERREVCFDRGYFMVWWCSGDSTRLVTSSADQSVKLWDCETGVQLHSFNFDAPARAVSFSEGDKMVVISTDPFMEQPSAIHVKRIEDDRSLRKCAPTFFHFISM